MKEITITDAEFIDVTGMLYGALIKLGLITESDKQKYIDITSGIMYIFTDEYADYRERRKQIEQYIEENPERDGKAQDGRGKGEA